MISSTKQQAIVGGPFHFRFTVAVAMEDLLRTPLCHTLRTNQMGYIKVKAQLPGIYGNVNPWQLGFNYYLKSPKISWGSMPGPQPLEVVGPLGAQVTIGSKIQSTG